MAGDRNSGAGSGSRPDPFAGDEKSPEWSVEQALFSQEERWGFLATILIELLPIAVWILCVLAIGALFLL